MLALGFLFTSWLPFALLLPWARRANGLRVAWLPALAGALAAAYAVITRRLWPEANIRVDLLPVLAVVFACDVVGLTIVTQVLLADRRAPRLTPPARLLARLAAVAGAAWLLVAGLGFSWSQLSLVRAVRRLDSGQRLLLAAKLRDRDSAAIAYGPLAAAEAQLGPWVGVWDLQPPAAWVRTMVIAGDRRVWVRFQCAVGECEAGPGTLELGDLGEAQATVGKMGGGGWALRLTTLPGGALRVGAAPLAGEARGPQTAAARRRVLPAAGPAIPGELTALGTYSALEWLPQHVALTEIRLWREGTKIHGLGLCSVVLPASDTMLFPQRFDTRVRSGGSFDLPLARCGGTLRPVSGGLELTGRDPRDWRWRRTVLLEHATRVADPALDLVPGTDLAAWRQWMRSVVPPVVQWKAPPRPAAAAEPAAPAANR